jgi:uncharacterized protein involved in tolerance to divalent cations
MTDKLVVFVSCEDRAQAEKIAGALVEEKLAACVNVLPGVRSCYVWEGKVTWAEELLLVIKTARGRYEDLEKRVMALHSYEVPEVIGLPIEAGAEKYLRWVEESVCH